MGAYDELIGIIRDVGLLGATAGVLSWDQEVMLPRGGIEVRSQQLAQLAKLVHERVTHPRIGELLDECEADSALTGSPHTDAAANVRELRRSYDRATKLPAELVEEMARTRSIAQHEWAEARQASDFAKFQPWLQRNLDLARRTAELYGWPEGGEPWDALAEGYEQGMTARDVESVFAPLRDRLQALVSDLMGATDKPRRLLDEISLPVDRQQSFVRMVAEAIGFDFARGRLDVSTHPFTSGSHPGDVRMTTRFSENGLAEALLATMHESGHAIYEQGLPPEHGFTPLGEAVSLGIHESQSRMWENQVGRSEAFWEWCTPLLRDHFGAAVSELTPAATYRAANVVQPGFIRVEADEATYNLHIMIRFELERALVSGELEVADVPAEWNRRYKEYLGVDVPDDAQGCLQDIHWSMGAFGYFPTYTLGNLYCAQVFETACEQIPGLVEGFARGEFEALRAWLNTNVHEHGSRYLPSELCERITGAPLSAEALIRHLEGKLRPLYGV